MAALTSVDFVADSSFDFSDFNIVGGRAQLTVIGLLLYSDLSLVTRYYPINHKMCLKG